jgi:erythromycin esterase-like protein
LTDWRSGAKSQLRDALSKPRLERAIGVVYRPETELASHYFHALLADQFDEFIWFDRTHAVDPISNNEARHFPSDHPFSLVR